jgi:hypothetical protein
MGWITMRWISAPRIKQIKGTRRNPTQKLLSLPVRTAIEQKIKKELPH